MKSPHCFVSLLLCAALLLSSLSGTALATETASVFEFDYAFEEYWYDDEAPAALVGDFPVRSALLMEAEAAAFSSKWKRTSRSRLLRSRR